MAAAKTTEESDADLLQLISWREEYPDEAKAAFATFHARHAEFLFGACLRRFEEKLPTYMTVEDLVEDTFVRVLERAGTFDAGGETDPVRLRHLTRGWLIAIAHNLLNDAYRDRLTREESRDGDFFDEQEFGDPPEDSPRVRLVERAFREALDEREQDVLRTTMMWNKPGAKQQRLPNDVSAALVKRLRTTPENIRKIRASGLAKVKAFIEANENSSNDIR